MSGPVKSARPARNNDRQKALEEALYTFATVRALPHLPNSGRALAYLERLRDDPGVRKVMRKHKWKVGLLKEMEPIGNTDMNSRTLGKNWNKGEAIEIRVRTDSYDGYRDYKTVRKTMAHELAHMVHSEHDRNFWDLCNKLEKEIESGDWTSGGRALTNEVYYTPPEQEQQADEKRWEGGSFKLGGGGATKGSLTGTEKPVERELSRREVMARAAEERLKKLSGGK